MSEDITKLNLTVQANLQCLYRIVDAIREHYPEAVPQLSRDFEEMRSHIQHQSPMSYYPERFKSYLQVIKKVQRVLYSGLKSRP